MSMVGHKQAARMLGVTAGTLYNWRSQGIGPVYTADTKKGPGRSRILYDTDDIKRWLECGKCPACGRPLLMRDR